MLPQQKILSASLQSLTTMISPVSPNPCLPVSGPMTKAGKAALSFFPPSFQLSIVLWFFFYERMAAAISCLTLKTAAVPKRYKRSAAISVSTPFFFGPTSCSRSRVLAVVQRQCQHHSRTMNIGCVGYWSLRRLEAVTGMVISLFWFWGDSLCACE